MFDRDTVLPPFKRLLPLAAGDTNPSHDAADLLVMSDTPRCNGIEPTTMRTTDGVVATHVLAVPRLVARRHKNSSASGDGDAFEAVVERSRPALVECAS